MFNNSFDLLSLFIVIGLTLGQPNSPFISYSPRRTFEQAIFDQSDKQFLNYQFQPSYQPSIIESRSSTNHNLSDDSSTVGHQVAAVANVDENKSNHEQKVNELVQQQQQHNNNHHPIAQLHPSTYYLNTNFNQQPQSSSISNNLINKPTENSDEHQFNHYDLDSSIYHQQQSPNLHSRLHTNQQPAHTSYHQSTPVPILRLKNTKIDGKLAPTLIITLPKKRKTNGKSRRFPFLKAIVSSFISTDRRTSTPNPNNDPQQQQATLSKQSKNQLHNQNSQPQQQSSNLNAKLDQSRIQQPIYTLSSSNTNNVQQLRSQSIVPTDSQNSNPIQQASNLNNQNAIDNQNGNLNSNLNSQPKEETKSVNSNEFEDNFHLPTKDELDDDDEEFGEWSEAPRPHNFDENQYYIESNKIKYSSAANGHEPIKQADHLGQYSINQQQSTNNQQNSSNQKKPSTFKYSASNTSPDFESMH